MILPKKLKLGDTIGIIAPSSPAKNELIDYNLKVIETMGFNIVEGTSLRKSYGYLAGSDLDRAEDLMHMFSNPKIDAIICYRGGYGCIRLMPYIDWNLISHNPKIFCGYSDITLLLNYINKKCNLVTFHGPMISSNFKDSITKDSLFSTLMTASEPYILNINQKSNIEIYNERSISGTLCGGNLAMICSALSTPFEVDIEDKILLLEDVDEKSYAVDRMLTQLLLSGKLKTCKGFIIGNFTPNKTKGDFSLPLLTVIKNILLPLNKPTIIGIPFGHEYPNITFPIGSKVKITFSPLCIKIITPVVI